MYLFAVNRTFVYENHVTLPFTFLMILILISTLFGMFIIIFLSVTKLFNRHYGMHINTTLLFENFALIYLVLCPAIFIIICLTFDWKNTGSIIFNLTAYLCSKIKSIIKFI